MRVLAHPTRLRLLGLLRRLGPQTAALLAEHVDEAPGTLSYHLSKLAQSGFIEEAPEEGADRRERWWRATHAETVWDEEEFSRDPEKHAAYREMSRVIGQHYAQNLDEYVQALPNLPEEWVRAALITDRQMRLTAPELAELRRETAELEQRWLAVSSAHAPGDDSEEVVFLAQIYRKP